MAVAIITQSLLNSRVYRRDNYNSYMELDRPSMVVVLSLLLIGLLVVVVVLVPHAVAVVDDGGNDSTAAGAGAGSDVVDDIASCNHLVLHLPWQ